MHQVWPIAYFPDPDVCAGSQKLVDEHNKKFRQKQIIMQVCLLLAIHQMQIYVHALYILCLCVCTQNWFDPAYIHGKCICRNTWAFFIYHDLSLCIVTRYQVNDKQ